MNLKSMLLHPSSMLVSHALVSRRVSVLTRAPIFFGLIPKEHWFQPDWIDEDRARAGRQKMMAQRIIYGGKLHHMIGNTSSHCCTGSVPYVSSFTEQNDVGIFTAVRSGAQIS